MSFPEAHPEQKMTKKWLHAKVKDIAEREKGRWVVHAKALADAGKHVNAAATTSPLMRI